MPDRRDLEKVYAKDEGPTEKTPEGDVFGDEAEHDIQYKTLSWQVSALCAGIVVDSTHHSSSSLPVLS